MSADDSSPEGCTDGDGPGTEQTDEGRSRLERGANKAVDQFDRSLVDLLSWILDTETRARIYVHLRERPWSTSNEVADGTGLYPSTVRQALAALHEEGRVHRRKRESDGVGNNPYEYHAMPPSDLVGAVVDDVQTELNRVCNLDRYLGTDDGPAAEPVTITVTEDGNDESTG